MKPNKINQPIQKQRNNWLRILWILLIIWGLSMIVAGFYELFSSTDEISGSGNIAIIPINGEITTGSAELFGSGVANSYEIIELIDKADKNPNIQAIVFEINSPGGSPVATDEIASRIKKINKPTIALIREVGASGAYWIASSTDYVIANRMSIVGSIGVYSSYLEFSKFLNRYNVTYTRLVAGDYKDMGSPMKELTSDERKFLQDQIDVLYGYFIDEIANNRNLSRDYVKNISNGLFYLGAQGKELGLVDSLGGRDQVQIYLNDTYNMSSTSFVIYEKKESLMDILRGVSHQKSANSLEIQKYINEGTPLIRT